MLAVGVTTFGCDSGRSGIGRYTIQVLRALDEMDVDARFEVLAYPDEADVFVTSRRRTAAVTDVGPRRGPIRDILWHQNRLGRICRRRGWDVLFLPAGNRRLPLWSPVPSVGTVHDFSSIHVPGKYDAARMFYIRRVLPLLIRRLTRVLTVSESSARDIVEIARVPRGRITVTHLAADAGVYRPGDGAADASRMSSKFGFGTPYILYISRIEHPGKNHVALIRAFSRLARESNLPHSLVLAGGDWGRAEVVHREAERSPAAGRIRFTGFVAGEDLPALVRGADLFVFPSLYEGFGLPLLEAMSCGTPTACADISSLPEVAGGASAMFDPNDDAAICAAVRGVLEDGARRAALVDAGLRRAAGFTWGATAEKTWRALGDAAATGHRRASR